MKPVGGGAPPKGVTACKDSGWELARIELLRVRRFLGLTFYARCVFDFGFDGFGFFWG